MLSKMMAWMAALLVASSYCGVAEASASDDPPRDSRSTFPPESAIELQAALDEWAKAPHHRGVSATVVLADGAEWVSTAGIAGIEQPLRPEHLVCIASITKTMTGSVIMDLAKDGVLELDDPISRWLDQRDNIDPEITIRELLNHTNGLANYTRNPALNDQINVDTSHVFTSDELIAYVGPKSFERGVRTQYTNTSFVLLGMIASVVTDQSITELYHERLWQPQGLDEIFLPGLEEPTGPVARAWAGKRSEQEEIDPLELTSLITIGNSAFGLFSNARTVARWGRALFAGNVLGTEMRSEMLDFVPAAGNIPGESGAGLGIRRYSYLDREQWGHSGGSPLGSSLMLYDPTTGVTVAVLMNQGRGADHFALAPQLLSVVTDKTPGGHSTDR